MTEKVMRLRDGEKWVRYSDYEALGTLCDKYQDEVVMLEARVEELSKMLAESDNEIGQWMKNCDKREAENKRLRESLERNTTAAAAERLRLALSRLVREMAKSLGISLKEPTDD